MKHIDGTPWGTRGGISVTHTFPADGDYTFRIMLHGTPTGQLFGSVASRNEQIDLSINGERVALLDIDYKISETDKNGLNLTTPRIHVKAGPQRIAAAFIQKFDGVVDDLVAPIDYTLADTEYGDNVGITILPHVRDFSITGPFKVTGVSDTPSRRKVFVCRPTSQADEIPCARRILSTLASEAYRRTANNEDVESLMEFYGDARKGHDFEAGIKAALQALLASPKFVFRFESTPPTAKPGQTYRISDLDLASRLSFFIWGTVPDAELVKVATAGTLHTPAVLEKQVRRMLADPRAEAMSTRFASQWLRLQDVEKIHPDALLFPSLRQRAGGVLQARDRAALRQHRPRGPQRPRPADGRLHVRERAHRQGLRHSEHHGRELPPRDARRREPARHPRAGQHPDADVGRRPHVAGAARQVDHGSAARIAAAAAAAERAAARRHEGGDRDRQGAVDARAHGRAPQEPGVRVVPPRDRSARARARELRRHSARGASRTTASASTPTACCTTARK